jgi:hypothetical protein
LATALSYLDRENFPLVASEIRKEIPINSEQFARLNSYFLFAYAILYAGGGRILDWLGTRVGYAIMIVVGRRPTSAPASSIPSLASAPADFFSAWAKAADFLAPAKRSPNGSRQKNGPSHSAYSTPVPHSAPSLRLHSSH